nr:transposase [Oceanococcus sp. HetDA_MAG_MS8]
MPRRARLVLTGYPLHIIQRGNNRSACFFADEDYTRYLDDLRELAEFFAVHIHAYVLMTNHVHLLAIPHTDRGASNMMRRLGQRYVQYINRIYGRSGSLWEGRFRSAIVDSEAYLLSCYRYIELNPVRAGMVPHPGDYPWWSNQANANGEPNTAPTPHHLYLDLGPSAEAQREQLGVNSLGRLRVNTL